MIKWPIQYTDFNGEIRKEDFFFHLSEADLAEIELIYHQFGVEEVKNEETGEVIIEAQSALGGYLQDTVRSGDGQRIVDAITDLIRRSYGIKTPDGRSFIKTDHDYLVFKGTPAYSSLFMSLAYNPDLTAKFFVGILPESMKSGAEERLAENITPGFRPGADTSRPVPPVAGAHAAQPVAEEAPRGFPVDTTPSLPPIGVQPQATVETQEVNYAETPFDQLPERDQLRYLTNPEGGSTQMMSAQELSAISPEDAANYQQYVLHGVNTGNPRDVEEYKRLFRLHHPGQEPQ